MTRGPYIAPSILAADFATLGTEIKKIENDADFLHVDVMDGQFVPNISLGIPVVASIRKVTRLPFDVHLMISEPEKFIEDFAEAGADLITFHIEAVSDPLALIEKIHSLGKKAGISLRPDTPVDLLFPFLSRLDLILVMSVDPGFGGQRFINEALLRIRNIKEELRRIDSPALISVDGGIDDKTASSAIAAGADILVAGSYIFKAKDPAGAIRALKNCVLEV